MLDSAVLIVRNLLQFGRLAILLKRCGSVLSLSTVNPLLTERNGAGDVFSTGTSIFSRPPPIDLSQAREAALQLDLDLEDDEAIAAHHLTSNATRSGTGGRGYDLVREQDDEPPRRGVGPVGGDRGRENLSADDEDQWDRMV